MTANATTRDRHRMPACRLAVAGLLALAACASTPPPLAELDAADAALTQARTLGAAELAPVELDFADTKRAAASAAMEQRDYARARQLAGQVAVDAELAAAKARAASARAAVQVKTSDNAELRRDLLDEGQRP